MAWLHSTIWAPSPTGPRCRGVMGVGSGALSLGLSAVGLGDGNGTPLQYSCLENPMDGGAW